MKKEQVTTPYFPIFAFNDANKMLDFNIGMYSLKLWVILLFHSLQQRLA